MQYLGGKSRIAKPLCAFLKAELGNRVFQEPFCGGLSITCGMWGAEFRLAYDYSQPLITLYKSLQAGWIPPETLTEAEYLKLNKTRDPLDPMTAFAGYGCSFGAKYFGGYARNAANQNYARFARNSLLRKLALVRDVVFECASYLDLETDSSCLVYCDPPYANTTGYSATGAFDSAQFWGTCRNWAKSGALVFVSEYAAPDFAREVWSIETKTKLHGEGQKGRTERLFQVF